METWRIFENSCTNFLNEKYGDNILIFKGSGMSDSTKSDIAVLQNNKLRFFIECKMSKAQSGQFVLLDKGSYFVFSPQNKSEENEFSDMILEYINTNYEIYKDVSTAATRINLPGSIYAAWIKKHYQSKDVKYVITADNHNNYIIFPIEKYGEYFNISANFRVKRSGSRDLSKNYEYDLKTLVENKYGPCKIQWDGKKAYCVLNAYIPDKTKLYGTYYRYQLNMIEPNIYQVRMLSNTNNSNVIFSIELAQMQQRNDLILFEKDIE